LVRQAAIGLALLLAVSAARAETRRVAVVVGANDGAEFRVTLRHAERDARKVAEVLQELGSVAPEDVTLLAQKPTARDVIAALRAVEKRAEREPIALIFYYSGHADGESLELSGTRLSLKKLRAYLKQSKAAVRLAVLDACHSGAAVRAKGGKRTRKQVSFGLDGGLAAQGYAILTSSAAGEESQESDEIRGSFFTHHLVSGLRGAADVDTDKRVTLSEAYRYAYARTLRQTAKARVAQHPHFDLKLTGGNDVVLTQLAARRARVRVAGKQRAQWILYQPSSGLVVAEVDERPGKGVTVAVPPGELDVYRRSGSSVARGTVEARAGAEVVLSRKSLETVPLTAYLFKGQAGVSLTAAVGVQGFADDTMRTEYMGPAPIFNIGFTVRDAFAYGFDLGFDIGFTSIDQRQVVSVGEYSQRLTEVQVGTSLKYRHDFGSFSVAAGPRIAYLYLDRSPSLADLPPQAIHTVAAGGVLGLYWRFSERISIGIDGRVSYVPMQGTGDSSVGPGRDQVMVELQAASAFHF